MVLFLRLSISWPCARYKCFTACMVLQAVVKAKGKSQSNGKGQIATSSGSETPELILMKLLIYNYIEGMTTRANPCGAATTWVVWENRWYVICFGYLVYLKKFFALFFGSPRPHQWPDFEDTYVLRRVSSKGSAFWGSRLYYCCPFWVSDPQKLLFWGHE